MTNIHNKQVKVTVDEKLIVFLQREVCSSRQGRTRTRDPKSSSADPATGPSRSRLPSVKYVKDLVFNKKTGEVVIAWSISAPQLISTDCTRGKALDGYYAIVTSELNMKDEDVIDTCYRGLWRIEESFRITKSELEARPVYVSREDRINVHFLTCFVSLLLLVLPATKNNVPILSRKAG